MEEAVYPQEPILIVDDEAHLVRSVQIALRSEGIGHTRTCADGREAQRLLAAERFEAVILDLNMPGTSGEALLAVAARECPDVPVVIVTGANEVETAVRCMKAGASDYLVKPVDAGRLIAAARRAIELRELRRENSRLRQCLLSPTVEHPEAFADFVTGDPAVLALFRYAEAIAVSSQPILITGETGTGKELMAAAIHALSRKQGRFVPVNVAGLDDTMFSDTLFGHVRGAYTGAAGAREGMIERAAHGTLFLDEIGDLAVTSQVKLLRLLQDGEYLALGSDIAGRSTARIVVATNRDIRERLRGGQFRDDLYYRLATHHIHLPALRQRPDDLPLLLNHFLAKSARSLGKPKPAAACDLLNALAAYDFPGNVRELESMVHDAVARHREGPLSAAAFADYIRGRRWAQPATPAAPAPVAAAETPDAPPVPGPAGARAASDAIPTLEEAADRLVREALHRTGGNRTAAARLLGISRQTLIQRLKKTGTG